MAKEIAKKKDNLPSTGHDYGEEAGAGFEKTKSSELAIPFLGVLQSNSPQVEDNSPEGSKAGMLYNTVTRELIDPKDGGVVFLPCHYDTAYVEWVPRDSGGGFVGLHDAESDVVRQAIADNDGKAYGKLKVGDNDLVETYYVYGLIMDDAGKESASFAVLSFSSTKIKPYRDWLTAMFTIKGKPPIFANRARLKTVKQKNDKGTFFNFQIDPLNQTWVKSLIDPKTEAGLLAEAKEFRTMVTSGMARAAFETERSTGDDPAAPAGDAAPF